MNLIFLAPIAIILVLLSVANRHWVTFSLDPLNTTWIAQGKHRKALRDTAYENTCLKRDYEKEHPESKKQATEIAPGLPLISRRYEN